MKKYAGIKKFTTVVAVVIMAAVCLNAGAQTVLLDEDWQSPSYPNNTSRLSGDFAGWTVNNQWTYSNREDNQGDLPGDATTTFPNQCLQFVYDSAQPEYDISHNWTATDVYYLMVQASPSSWNGHVQRYVRPELHQQDGTVLWDPGENLSGPEKTVLPKDVSFGSSTWQAEPDLNFSFTIDASTFTAGTEGQSIALRLDSSGPRGIYVDNVSLTLAGAGGGTVIAVR